ncbi:hypothetical protein IV203_004507 [Nitzschia inconspicua]|uniref:Uncharacterized protein n=1 Tax=Nitzschia inconspicua TaxID=303405 RepID=A0A9K3PQ54_9STRA|nr:hypothetical protein IV203_004507 [Nitzschia inconspicua]
MSFGCLSTCGTRLLGRPVCFHHHYNKIIHQKSVSPAIRRYLSSSSSSSETYYDSQSGLYIPVHKEQDIRLFLDTTKTSSTKNDYDDDDDTSLFAIPQHLYKSSEEAYEVTDQLQSLVAKGIHGVILPPFQFPRDHRNKKALSTLVPPGFRVLYHHHSSREETAALLPQPQTTKNDDDDDPCSLVLSFHKDNVLNHLEQAVQNGSHTTLQIHDGAYSDKDAITIANHVASMIDTIGGGGYGCCDFLWLSCSQTQQAEKLVEVCEELIYLDVAGPTINSRILMDVVNVDVVEDVMFAGVNKFVVQDESQIDMVQATAASQGKQIIPIHES